MRIKSKTLKSSLIITLILSSTIISFAKKSQSNYQNLSTSENIAVEDEGGGEQFTETRNDIAVEDTQVDGGNPSTNYGNEMYFMMSGEIGVYKPDRGFVSFYFSNKPEDVIKAEVRIEVITFSELGDIDVSVYQTSAGWDENELVWNNKPALGTKITSFIVSDNGYYTFDVSIYVSGSSLSICLKYTDETITSGGAIFIMSKEAFDEDGFPQLIWTYNHSNTIPPIHDEPPNTSTIPFGNYYMIFAMIAIIFIMMKKRSYTENDI